METTDRKLEEVLAWFSQAMGPTLAALYCAVGPEWITNVIQSGSSRWKPTALSTDEETDTQTPVSIEGDMNWTDQE